MDLKKNFNDTDHDNHLDSIEKKLTNMILLMRAILFAEVVIIGALLFFIIKANL